MPILLLHMVHFAEGAWAMAGTAGAGARAAVATPMVVTRGASMLAIATRNWGGRAWSAARERGSGTAAGGGTATHAIPPGFGSATRAPVNPSVRGTAGPAPVGRGPERTSGPDAAPTGGDHRVTEDVDASQRHQAHGVPDPPGARRGGQQAPSAPSVDEREAGRPSAPPPDPSRRRPARDPFEDEG
jgi:hypothetical protein